MEPDDLNDFLKPDPRLDALLRQSSAPLSDDGFSARVVAALPVRRSPSAAYRLLWCLVWAIAGVAVAWYSSADWATGDEGLNRLAHTLASVTQLIFDPSFLLAVTIAAGSLVLAFWPGARWSGRLDR